MATSMAAATSTTPSCLLQKRPASSNERPQLNSISFVINHNNKKSYRKQVLSSKNSFTCKAATNPSEVQTKVEGHDAFSLDSSVGKIKHSHVNVRGLKLHVAEIGTGSKVVLFLHGFPEIWYSWRHQMVAVANAGYRAVAIDFRGYGLSETPAEPEKATFIDLVDDVVALLDILGADKAYLVGKDFGGLLVNLIAALHPNRVSGIVTLGTPFMLPGPSAVPAQYLPKGFYIMRWLEPGRAEADFGRFDVKTVIKNIYILFSGSELPAAADDQEIMDLVDPSTPLPPWFSEDDLSVYASLYEKHGFSFAMVVPYRNLGVDLGITDAKVTAPALLVMGEQDYVLKFPGMEDYVRSGQVKYFVPDLDTIFVEEGNHFIQEKLPELVNDHIIKFLNKHSN